jgi:hypothetical protein
MRSHSLSRKYLENLQKRINTLALTGVSITCLKVGHESGPEKQEVETQCRNQSWTLKNFSVNEELDNTRRGRQGDARILLR